MRQNSAKAVERLDDERLVQLVEAELVQRQLIERRHGAGHAVGQSHAQPVDVHRRQDAEDRDGAADRHDGVVRPLLGQLADAGGVLAATCR